MNRRFRGDGPLSCSRLPEPALDTLFSAKKGEVTAADLHSLVEVLGRVKRMHIELIESAEGKIRELYDGLDAGQRAKYFEDLYDSFAKNYDHHMGVETGHFRAIRKVFRSATEYIQFPILDITAGSGELLKYTLEFFSKAGKMIDEGSYHDYGPMVSELPENDMKLRAKTGIVVANEISRGMQDIAREKLCRHNVQFPSFNACDIPQEYWGIFKTVLVSQTFHLLSEEDKQRLVESMHRALVPGGMAVVFEEFPFLISETSAIDSVGLKIGAVAQPLEKGTLIAHLEKYRRFDHIDESASALIDPGHSMHLFLFQKN